MSHTSGAAVVFPHEVDGAVGARIDAHEVALVGRPLPCASGAVAPELPGGCAGRAGRAAAACGRRAQRGVGPGAACSVLMYPASLDDYKGSDVTHILTGTSEIGHIHWDESIHSLE